jgi:hypothetical protein
MKYFFQGNFMSYNAIKACRICHNDIFEKVISLGDQYLTGVFPTKTTEKITKGPLDLLFCRKCHLLQLGHSYDLGEMYGDNYGYRSGLNQSMVDHLTRKICNLENKVKLSPGDCVLDIGSNDCTTLKAYTTSNIKRVGIDPTAQKFKEFYPHDVTLISDFFSASAYKTKVDQKAKIVTSIAMFYDLESPVDFAKQIHEILDDNGIWHFEQSYMPLMLNTTSYDTICHEHLEYYSLHVIKNILELANLEIADVTMNGINGGSFAVTAVKVNNKTYPRENHVINWLLEKEIRSGVMTLKPFEEFRERIYRHREDLISLLSSIKKSGKTIFGYGASTKGNVLLQFCDIGTNYISAIADVNKEKFGRFTPGTNIPIISEAEAKSQKPDYYLVLPWHFKNSILNREKDFMNRGGKFIFPLPEIEIV